MTDQEMFNRAWNGLKSQGFERCTGDIGGQRGGVCVTMNSDGMRCAASWVMAGEPWDDAKPGLCRTDGLHRVQEMGSQALFLSGLRTLGEHLQRAHDLADDAAEVERNLRELAAIAGLEIPNE